MEGHYAKLGEGQKKRDHEQNQIADWLRMVWPKLEL